MYLGRHACVLAVQRKKDSMSTPRSNKPLPSRRAAITNPTSETAKTKPKKCGIPRAIINSMAAAGAIVEKRPGEPLRFVKGVVSKK